MKNMQKRPIGTWEGANVYLVKIVGGRPKITELVGGKSAAMEESHKHPIGIIIKNKYDTGGIGNGSTERMAVFYKGKNAEILNATDLEHPHIFWLEQYLSGRDDRNIDESAHLPIIDYERPEVNMDNFRKKKSSKAKAKPKRKIVKKKTKSCGCK